MEDRRQFGMKLSVDLIARVDEARGSMSRTAYVERALETMLGTSPLIGAGTQAAVESAVRGASVDTPARAVERQATRSHVSQLPTMAEMKAKRAEQRRNG